MELDLTQQTFLTYIENYAKYSDPAKYFADRYDLTGNQINDKFDDLIYIICDKPDASYEEKKKAYEELADIMLMIAFGGPFAEHYYSDGEIVAAIDFMGPYYATGGTLNPLDYILKTEFNDEYIKSLGISETQFAKLKEIATGAWNPKNWEDEYLQALFWGVRDGKPETLPFLDYLKAYDEINHMLQGGFEVLIPLLKAESEKDGPVFQAAWDLMKKINDMENGGTIHLWNFNYTFNYDGVEISIYELLGIEENASTVNMEKMAELCDIMQYGYDPNKDYRYFDDWKYGNYFLNVDDDDNYELYRDLTNQIKYLMFQEMNSGGNWAASTLSYDKYDNVIQIKAGENKWSVQFDYDYQSMSTLDYFDSLKSALKQLQTVTSENGGKSITDLAEECGLNESYEEVRKYLNEHPEYDMASVFFPDLAIDGEGFEAGVLAEFQSQMEAYAKKARVESFLGPYLVGSAVGAPPALTAMVITLLQMNAMYSKSEKSIGFYTQVGLDNGLTLEEAMTLANLVVSGDYMSNNIDIWASNLLFAFSGLPDYKNINFWLPFWTTVPVNVFAKTEEFDVNKEGLLALQLLQEGVFLTPEQIQDLKKQLEYSGAYDDDEVRAIWHGTICGLMDMCLMYAARSIGTKSTESMLGDEVGGKYVGGVFKESWLNGLPAEKKEFVKSVFKDHIPTVLGAKPGDEKYYWSQFLSQAYVGESGLTDEEMITLYTNITNDDEMKYLTGYYSSQTTILETNMYYAYENLVAYYGDD